MIGHSSIAGQPGNIHNPRVLLFNHLRGGPEGQGQDLNAVLSINGGDTGLNQHLNVEMLYNNPQRREAELYDIEFIENRAIMSGRNPDLCLSCHGNGGTVGAGGPKTIFEPFEDWRRFVTGTLGICMEEEKKMLKAADAAARESLTKNPRYRCLDTKSNDGERIGRENQFALLGILDRHLDDLNSRRVAQIVRATPDFEKYKYVIIGANVCGLFGEVEQWMPADQIRKHDSQSRLSESMRGSADLVEAYRAAVHKKMEINKKIAAEQIKITQDIRRWKSPELKFTAPPEACKEDDSRKLIKQRIEKLANDIKKQPRELARFVADTKLYEIMEGRQQDPSLRFLFEGRGLDISDWSTEPTPGYLRAPTFLARHLMALEASDSELRKLEPEFKKAGILRDPGASPSNFGVEFQHRERPCRELKKLSMAAFNADARIPKKDAPKAPSK